LDGADAGDGLGNTVFEDKEVVGLEARDELVRLVKDNAGVDVDDGDVDAEGVGFVVGILDFRGYGRRWRRGLIGFLLLLEDDGAIVGVGAGVVGGRFGLLRRVLSGSVLTVRGRQR